jgi:hypothetical protein
MKVHNKITTKRVQKARRDKVRLCIRCGRAQKPRSKGPNCYGCGENMVHSADSILKMLSGEEQHERRKSPAEAGPVCVHSADAPVSLAPRGLRGAPDRRTGSRISGEDAWQGQVNRARLVVGQLR